MTVSRAVNDHGEAGASQTIEYDGMLAQSYSHSLIVDGGRLTPVAGVSVRILDHGRR